MRRPSLIAIFSVYLSFAASACPRRVEQPELEPAQRANVEEAMRQAQAGHSEEALKLVAELRDRQDSEVAEVLFAVAESQLHKRAFAGARNSYRDLLTRFPLFTKGDLARYHLAVAHLELGEWPDALQTLSPLYPKLSESDRPQAARELARAAEGARAWPEALRWHSQAAALAGDGAIRRAELDRVLEIVDSKIGFVDVARLCQEISPSSPAWPLLQLKLAKIHTHLRDYPRSTEALEELLAEAPQSPWAPEARALLDRAQRRTQIKPDTLGVVLPMSGKFKGSGESVMAGIQLALKGSSLRIVIRDSAGDAAQARQEVASLAQDEQVIAVIGPILTAESEDAAVEAELQETPIVTLTRAEGITGLGSYVFRNMLTYSAQAKALVDWGMRVKGYKRFAVLYPSIPYGTEMANLFWDEVEANDGEIRGAETYEADQTTFAVPVKRLVGRQADHREEYLARKREIEANVKDPFRQRKMKEEALKKLEPIIDFDALFIPDYYRTIGLVAPALAVEDVITNACDKRDLERIAKTAGKGDASAVKTVQLLGGNGWNFPELVERGGKFVQCAVFVDGFFAGSDRKETRTFVNEFRTATARDPALLEAVGYDTAKILRTVIERQKPSSRAALRDALLQVRDFPGATGPTTINAKREAEKPLFMLTIEGGEIRELDSDVKS